MGPDGYVQREARRALEITSLAGEVLRRIWEAPESSNDDKEAQSTWVGYCLWFKQAEVLPVRQPSPEGRAGIIIHFLPSGPGAGDVRSWHFTNVQPICPIAPVFEASGTQRRLLARRRLCSRASAAARTPDSAGGALGTLPLNGHLHARAEQLIDPRQHVDACCRCRPKPGELQPRAMLNITLDSVWRESGCSFPWSPRT